MQQESHSNRRRSTGGARWGLLAWSGSGLLVLAGCNPPNEPVERSRLTAASTESRASGDSGIGRSSNPDTAVGDASVGETSTGDAGATPRTDATNDDCDDSDASRTRGSALYADGDGDGFGDIAHRRWVCEGVVVSGFVGNAADCDDADPQAHQKVYLDRDSDGYGTGEPTCGEEGMDGLVKVNGDCDDDDSAIKPEIAEDVSYDGVDRNCDGYDIPVWNVENEPGELVSWDQGALCPAYALAVVGMERVVTAPGGVFLQLGHVGTRDIFEASLVLRKFDPPNADVVTTIALPTTITPNGVFRIERITDGDYEVTFDYGPTSVVPNESTVEGDGGAVDTGWTTHPYVRCPLVRMPFAFTSGSHP